MVCSEPRGGEGGDEETVLNSFGFLDDEDSDEDDNEDEEEEEGGKGFYQQDLASVSQREREGGGEREREREGGGERRDHSTLV